VGELVRPFQCRTILKNGHRCPHTGKYEGFCGKHSAANWKKFIKKAKTAAEIVVAFTTIIEAIRKLIEAYHSVAGGRPPQGLSELSDLEASWPDSENDADRAVDSWAQLLTLYSALTVSERQILLCEADMRPEELENLILPHGWPVDMLSE